MKRSLWWLAVGAAAAVGTALAYYLDPFHGAARRRAARQWTASTMRALRGKPASLPVGVEPAQAEPDGSEAAAVGIVYLEGDPARRPRIVAYDRPTEAAPPPPARRRPRLPSRLLAGAAAASASSAIVLAGWAVLLERDSEVSNAANPPRLSEQRRAISLLAQRDARHIPVRGAGGAVVLVVGRRGQAALVLGDLARAPAGRAYEAWVIDGATRRAAGLFSGAERVVTLTRAVPRGATIAVTLERAGGAASPTTRPLFAARNS